MFKMNIGRPKNDGTEFWNKVNKEGENGCWEYTGGRGYNGYGQYWLDGKNIRAHRYSYILHHPLTIDLLEGHREIIVCHRCDNPKCVNPAHLFLGASADNTKDMMAKGRKCDKKGEKHHMVKLTETQVREIRTKYANGGITYKQLGLEYGVTESCVRQAFHGKSWSHIEKR